MLPARLIIEADGPTHTDSAHDAKRDAWFTARGFTVLRFANRLIENHPQSVLDAIVEAAPK